MSLPLHSRVADALRAQIVDGTLPVGAPMPSEATLCTRFEASRGTVRAATTGGRLLMVTTSDELLALLASDEAVHGAADRSL